MTYLQNIQFPHFILLFTRVFYSLPFFFLRGSFQTFLNLLLIISYSKDTHIAHIFKHPKLAQIYWGKKHSHKLSCNSVRDLSADAI